MTSSVSKQLRLSSLAVAATLALTAHAATVKPVTWEDLPTTTRPRPTC